MNTTKLENLPEENEKMYRLLKEDDLYTKNITVYSCELSNEDFTLCLENNLTAEFTDIKLPIDMLLLAIEESGETKSGFTRYSTDSIEEDVEFFQPPLSWWDAAKEKDQHNILRPMLKQILRESLQLARKDKEAA